MIKLTLQEAIAAMGGRVRDGVAAASVAAVSTDSRTLSAGELFFAIAGERFDGHCFVVDALRRGASGAVVCAARGPDLARVVAAEAPEARGPLVFVDDPVAALGRLAAFHRRQLAAEVIAVVGSNGKTTTKAMIAHVLSGRRRGRASPRSFNNAIGVPLTLLAADAADEFLVVEVGTNAPGEVSALGAIVQPDLAVITSIGEEHLEGLGDLHGVAREECAILRALRKGGFAAVNGDAPEVRAHLPADGPTIATFGRSDDADLRVSDVAYAHPWLTFTLNRRFAYRLRMAGVHNALNAAAAALVAKRLMLDHVEIAERLASFAPPPMRGEIIEVGGVTVYNDAYNANPSSARAALDAFAALPCERQRIVVFGEMRELGSQTPALHEALARRLAQERVQRVLLVGAAVGWMHPTLAAARGQGPVVECFSDVPAVAARLSDLAQPGDTLLLKASRAVGLERVLEALRARPMVAAAV